jgi:hypothetical protein
MIPGITPHFTKLQLAAKDTLPNTRLNSIYPVELYQIVTTTKYIYETITFPNLIVTQLTPGEVITMVFEIPIS